MRRKRVSLAAAQQAIEAYKRIPIRFVDVELDEALRIAHALGIYCYDAYLIRCALRCAAPLISLDGGLIECARRMQVQLIEVTR